MAQVGVKSSSMVRDNATHGCILSNALTNMTLSEHEELTGKDASWILTTSVIIFTMQTGERKHAIEVVKLCF